MLQIAQHVDDLARAVDFYTVLLERPPLVVTETQAFFDLGEARLLLDGEAPVPEGVSAAADPARRRRLRG